MRELRFTPEAGEAFCDALVESNTVKEALDKTEICAQTKTIYTWLRLSERGDERFVFEWLGVKDQFHEHWLHAHTLQAQRLAEENETRARTLMDEVSDMPDQKKASNKIQGYRAFNDMVKWKAGALDRKRFGKQNDAPGQLVPVQVIMNMGSDHEASVSVRQKDVIENNNEITDQRLKVADESDAETQDD